ncbi:MAG: hypothetical protein ACRDFW_13930, partial [bacterium]
PRRDPSGAGRTAVTANEVKNWLSACSPDQPIESKDPRYVPLHAFKTEGRVVSLRGEDPILPVFDTITLSSSRSCQLFSGYIGTGKSTELKRLAQLLREKDYIVLYSDAQRYHDLAHPIAIEELLVILAGAFGEAAGEHLRKKDLIAKSYWQRFLEFLQTEINPESMTVNVGVADLKLNLMHGRPFWLKVRDALGSKIDSLRHDAHEFVGEVVATLKRHFSKAPGVVFLFDSLERLRGPENEFKSTMDSVIRVLIQYADLLQLPDCHVVLTVPPYAALIRPDLSDKYDNLFRVLPAIKVLERGPDETPFPDGILAMATIVEKRIPADRVFGAARRELLQKLIISSGGHVRTLLLFLRELLMGTLRGGLPVTEKQVDRVIELYAERARNSIRPEGVHLLDSVRRLTTLDEIQDTELGLLARYIDSHLVLCYQNDEGWFEVHPLVRDHVCRRAEEMAEAQPSP